MTMKLAGTAVAVLAVAAVSLSGCKSDDTKATPPAGATTPAGSDAAGSSPAPAPSPSESTAADNGVAKLSADAILKKATTALIAAKTFHVAGNDVEDGQKVSVDLKIAGKDGIGQLSIGKAKLEMLTVAGGKYIKPNEAFWEQNAGGAQKAKVIMTVVGDRWVKVPSSDKDIAGLFELFQVNDILKPDGKLTKGAAKQVGGVPAITLTDHGSPGGSMYVATTGRPVPLELDGGDKSVLKFSDFGATFTDIKKPAANQVMDFAAISGK
jgi:hypothetical protein